MRLSDVIIYVKPTNTVGTETPGTEEATYI
jgi:hypothetical protein